MQIIQHETDNIHPIFNEFDKLYTLTSEKKQKQTLISNTFSRTFYKLVDVFYEYSDIKYRVNYKKTKYDKIQRVLSCNNIIVCFSGGKDSIAVAKYYQDKGNKVYLYHMKGINQTYKDEYINAKSAADYMRLPIYFDTVNLKGTHDYIEHPLKNMILANGALQYGIREGIGTDIAFGNFSSSTLEVDPFEVCGGDCKELWSIYEDIIGTVLKDFKIQIPFIDIQDTIDILIKHSDLLQYSQSCIGPYRFRTKLHDLNVKKYNIDLQPNRCGSCWKCCLEYCVYCDKGIYEYNEAYYKHCLDILADTIFKETGIKTDADETWNHYFFYDMSESQYYSRFKSVDRYYKRVV